MSSARTRQSDPGSATLVAITVAALFTLAVLCLLAGCSSGRSADGKTVVGFPVGAELPEGAVEAAGVAGGAIGGIFGGPAGAYIGGAIATGLAGLFAAKKHADAKAATAQRTGERDGWEERELDQGKRDAEWYEAQRDADAHGVIRAGNADGGISVDRVAGVAVAARHRDGGAA